MIVLFCNKKQYFTTNWPATYYFKACTLILHVLFWRGQLHLWRVCASLFHILLSAKTFHWRPIQLLWTKWKTVMTLTIGKLTLILTLTFKMTLSFTWLISVVPVYPEWNQCVLDSSQQIHTCQIHKTNNPKNENLRPHNELNLHVTLFDIFYNSDLSVKETLKCFSLQRPDLFEL